jgi:hypothetical protein
MELEPIEMPSTDGLDGENGRDFAGRFLPGNTFGGGNPHAAAVAKLRAAALAAVSTEDIHAIFRKLVELALAGDVAAAREVFARTLGPVQQSLDVIMKQIPTGPTIQDEIELCLQAWKEENDRRRCDQERLSVEAGDGEADPD